jgi:hypothetical protein
MDYNTVDPRTFWLSRLSDTSQELGRESIQVTRDLALAPEALLCGRECDGFAWRRDSAKLLCVES